MDTESSFEGHESAADLKGIPGLGEARDLAALVAVVYGEEEVGEYVDKHDEWLAATRAWTFEDHVAGGVDDAMKAVDQVVTM